MTQTLAYLGCIDYLDTFSDVNMQYIKQKLKCGSDSSKMSQ